MLTDEDWNGDPAETTLYLMHQPTTMTLPRPTMDKSPEPGQRFTRYAEPHSPKYDDDYRQKNREETNKYLQKPITKYSENKYLERQKSVEREKHSSREKNFERQKSFDHLERDRLAKTIEKGDKYYDSHSDKYYCHDSRDKLDRYPESDRYDKYSENSRKYGREEYPPRRGEKEKPVKYFDDDGFDENIRYRSKSTEFERERPQRFSYDEEEYYDEKHRQYKEYPIPKARQKYAPEEDTKYYKEESSKRQSRCIPDDPRYYTEPEIKPRPVSKPSSNDKFEKMYGRSDRDREWEREEKAIRSQEFYEESTMSRKNPQLRQRSPSPEETKAPRDRFKDAKEKFLLMEKERLENERRRPEPPISPVNVKDKQQQYVKRNGNMGYSKEPSRSSYDERYYDGHRSRSDDARPKPAPRHIPEEVRYRDPERNSRERDSPVERYRHTDKFDPKRRSMFSLIEEEHKKNSNEIAKELKRRSYMENSHFDDDPDKYERERDMRDRHFQELPESDRFVDGFSKPIADMDRVGEMKYDQKFVKNQKTSKNAAGYRHSYAEPKLRMEKNGKKHFSDMLHRTNSSVGNNGRVGIASVHPY
ncbi:hypothetical protein NQ318_002062 [Aromia moschata]|uniref:Uncharacterized protein n=1 Tax=Aromia moschata TaxID=1265417 RepID=A0AAV8Z1W0_9CUCU|nr:hypothetical protein NQ318_002062 [Aromia moschata]